eukprot:jgi/Tetstr1/427619/TSEL_017744.t1
MTAASVDMHHHHTEPTLMRVGDENLCAISLGQEDEEFADTLRLAMTLTSPDVALLRAIRLRTIVIYLTESDFDPLELLIHPFSQTIREAGELGGNTSHNQIRRAAIGLRKKARKTAPASSALRAAGRTVCTLTLQLAAHHHSVIGGTRGTDRTDRTVAQDSVNSADDEEELELNYEENDSAMEVDTAQRAAAETQALLRACSLARNPQRLDGNTTSEPRPPAALGAAAKRYDPPYDPPHASVTFARPLLSDGDSLMWEDWTSIIAPGFAIQPAPGLSTTPDFYDIEADETSRILTEKRHLARWTSTARYTAIWLLHAVAHAALNEAAAAIEGAASEEVPPNAADIGVLKAAIVAFGASNQHRHDFVAYLRLKAAGDVDAGDKTLADLRRARLLRPRYADFGSPAVAALRERRVSNDKPTTASPPRRRRPSTKRFGGALTDDEPAPSPAAIPAAPAPPEDSKDLKLKPNKPKSAKIDG